MLTSMAIYSLYKYYKKWRSQDSGSGAGDGAEDGAGAGSSAHAALDSHESAAGDKNSIFHTLATYSSRAQSNLANNARTVLICTLYMFIGPSLILLNKHILTDLQVCVCMCVHVCACVCMLCVGWGEYLCSI